MTYLAVFKSRAQALDCVSALKREGIPARPVSTPAQAKAGCGLSVCFEENFLPRAQRTIGKKSYSAFSGYMRQTNGGFFYI